MEAARHRLFLPLLPRPPLLLPLPHPAPLLLPATLPPRAATLPPRAATDEEIEEFARVLWSRHQRFNGLKKLIGNFLGGVPSGGGRDVRRLRLRPLCPPLRFPDIRALLERLARSADPLKVAAILGGALLVYILFKIGAAGTGGADSHGFTGRLPPWVRHEVAIITAPLLARGSAPRAPWEWAFRFFNGDLAAALRLRPPVPVLLSGRM